MRLGVLGERFPAAAQTTCPATATATAGLAGATRIVTSRMRWGTYRAPVSVPAPSAQGVYTVCGFLDSPSNDGVPLAKASAATTV
jgi:hypothetical protein